MEPTPIPVSTEPHPTLTDLTGQLQGVWWGMRDLAKELPSRELSLAVTNAEQALMWLVKCSHSMQYQVPIAP